MKLSRLRAREDTGAAIVEYGLLVALIAVVVAVAAKTLGADIAKMFTDIQADIK